MKIEITSNTIITTYYDGNNHICTFAEDGESVNLSFDSTSLHKVPEIILKLEQVYQKLAEKRQKEITREFDMLEIDSSNLPVHIGIAF